MERWDLKIAEERDGKTFWHKVGVMFRSKSGEGFNLVFPPGISVTGRIVALVPKTEEEWANKTRASQGRPPRGQEQQGSFTPPAEDEDIPF